MIFKECSEKAAKPIFCKVLIKIIGQLQIRYIKSTLKSYFDFKVLIL